MSRMVSVRADDLRVLTENIDWNRCDESLVMPALDRVGEALKAPEVVETSTFFVDDEGDVAAEIDGYWYWVRIDGLNKVSPQEYPLGGSDASIDTYLAHGYVSEGPIR